MSEEEIYKSGFSQKILIKLWWASIGRIGCNCTLDRRKVELKGAITGGV